MGASTSGGKGNVTTPGQGGQPAYGQPSASMDMPQQSNTIGGLSEDGSRYGGQGALDQNAINANPQGFNQYQSQMQQREAQMPGSTMLGQQYGNTIGGWDNASIQPQSSSGKGSGSGGSTANSGKGQSGGKGQSSWQPMQSSWTPPVQATNVQPNVQPANVQPVSQYDYTGSGI